MRVGRSTAVAGAFPQDKISVQEARWAKHDERQALATTMQKLWRSCTQEPCVMSKQSILKDRITSTNMRVSGVVKVL